MIEIKVPAFGESIQEVQVAQWLKEVGQWVNRDEDLVELESEKATQAFPSPESGVVQEIRVPVGAFAKVGDVIAVINATKSALASTPESTSASTGNVSSHAKAVPHGPIGERPALPAAQRLMAEHGLSPSDIPGDGQRITKEDVVRAVGQRGGMDVSSVSHPQSPPPSPPVASQAETTAAEADKLLWAELGFSRQEEVRPMSMLRRTIAARLVEAQHRAALLTTFNEIDMQPVMDLRAKYKDAFQQKHGVKLGFMSFFAKATVESLKRFPAVNAEVRGNDVVYRSYYDIGIAIGGGKGLVVPVLRNVERLSFAEVEQRIGEFAELAKNNRLKPTDLEGGTFTISNGGVYGSLLSTPIVNPPQSGILGLHAIQERPVAVQGQVVIRPMMYVALTYDHRIIDGREAVGFLKTIKEVLEEPARLFLEV